MHPANIPATPARPVNVVICGSLYGIASMVIKLENKPIAVVNMLTNIFILLIDKKVGTLPPHN